MAKVKKHDSVNDGIDAAFQELNDAGIVAEQDVGGTMSMGWAEVNGLSADRDPPPRGAVFYHHQDRARALEGGGLFLAFGAYEDDESKRDAASVAIGREVVEALARHGVENVWDGTIEQRIQIPPFEWKKRGDKLANIERRLAAVEAGELEKVKQFPKNVLDQRDGFGRTALSIAAQNDYAEMVAWLLDAGAKPEGHAIEALFLRHLRDPSPGLAKTGTNHTLLHIAAWAGSEKVTRLLLERGFDREARDPYGATPLITAAMHKLETLEILLGAGADVTAHDVMGRTAMDHATDAAIVKRLLEAGAKPEGGVRLGPPFRPEPGHSFDSPVERFAVHAKWDLVERLLSKGAPAGKLLEIAMPAIVAENRWPLFERILAAGVTPEALDQAFVHSAWRAEVDRAALEKLRAAGAKSLDGALAMAIGRTPESPEIVEWLIREGARASVGALRSATVAGNVPLFERMLKMGAGLEDRDERGDTVLIAAVKGRNADMVKLLLERGASARTKDRNGQLPIQIAMASTQPGTPERRAILDLLAAHGGKPDDDGAPKAPEAPAAPKAGDTVEHAKFGRGRVLAVREDKCEVEFESAGKKVMLAKLLTVVQLP